VDEFPAVDLASGLKAGFRLARTSAVVSGRMPSSCVSISSVVLPSVVLHVDGHDLVLEAPLGGSPGGVLLAAGRVVVESSRETPTDRAIISAEMPWETRPPRSA